MSPRELWSWWGCYREDVVPLATLLGGLVGLWLLYIRTRATDRTARAALDQAKVAADQAKTAAERHEDQTRADRERRISESFAKAVEQLGSDKLETRLGAIYTLERISQEKESEREYRPIMETLTAYVRERVRSLAVYSPPPVVPPLTRMVLDHQTRPATDIQAILTVLGRRDEQARKRDEAEKRYLDLAETDLRGANLKGARLERIKLSAARLEAANLSGAHLEGADLHLVHLERAILSVAHLEGAQLLRAHLESAHLEGAYLEYTHLEEADLKDADLRAARGAEAYFAKTNLEGARLEDAELGGAKGLIQEQVDSALGNEKTTLPPGLTRPAHWSSATPNDRPGVSSDTQN
jgi:hypothetical protein